MREEIPNVTHRQTSREKIYRTSTPILAFKSISFYFTITLIE